MKSHTHATLSLERELAQEFKLVEYEKGNGDFHFHSQIEICIVEKGQLEAFVNNHKAVLQEGDIAVSLSYEPHRYVSADSAKYWVMIIPNDISEKFYSVMQTKSLANPVIRRSAKNAVMIDYIHKLKDDQTGELARLGYIYLVLSVIQDDLTAEDSDDTPDQELISKILIYIHQNSCRKITLNSVSAVFGYHPGYISGYFKSCLHIGFSQYVNLIRLKNAVQFMQQKKHSMNLTDIAFACGFGSTRTFNRVFYHEFGCSPSAYRNQRMNVND